MVVHIQASGSGTKGYVPKCFGLTVMIQFNALDQAERAHAWDPRSRRSPYGASGSAGASAVAQSDWSQGSWQQCWQSGWQDDSSPIATGWPWLGTGDEASGADAAAPLAEPPSAGAVAAGPLDGDTGASPVPLGLPAVADGQMDDAGT